MENNWSKYDYYIPVKDVTETERAYKVLAEQWDMTTEEVQDILHEGWSKKKI